MNSLIPVFGRFGSLRIGRTRRPEGHPEMEHRRVEHLSAAGTTYGAVALVTGKVLSGLFAGAQLEATAYVVGVDDPAGCLTTGSSEIDYVGEIRFEMLT